MAAEIPLQEKQIFNTNLKGLLCNALIQSPFDYACSAWYPNLNKKFKNKL